MRLKFDVLLKRGRYAAIDLGTANTVVFVPGRGVVLFEPSVVAIDDTTDAVLAVGEAARRMIGRTPASIRAIRPLRHGVIADFGVTEAMVRDAIAKAVGTRRSHPRLVLCAPSGITQVERQALEEAALAAGAAEVVLIEEPMAAAIGAGLPVAEAGGNFVVDIGGGTTEVAVISLGGMVVWESLRVGGYEMDDAIVRYAKSARGLVVGQENAEDVKIALATATDLGEERVGELSGRDAATGYLRRIEVTSAEIRQAVAGPIERIVDAVKATLEQTPPELAGDIMQRGIVLVGGGALVGGLDRRLSDETELPVTIVDSPLTCVAEGAGKSLEEYDAILRAGGATR